MCIRWRITCRRLTEEENGGLRTLPLKRPGVIITSKMAVNFMVVIEGDQWLTAIKTDF